MAKPSESPTSSRKTLITLFLIPTLCSLFYIFGSFTNSSSNTQTLSSPLCPQFNLTTTTPTTITTSSPSLDFKPHHILLSTHPPLNLKPFPLCPTNFTDYCPCHDPSRETQFIVTNKFHKERHCPDNAARCLVPKPVGYRSPFKWPDSKKFVWFNNVPYKSLVEYKKSQNWVRLEGNRFVFPGGGTSFRLGVKDYIDLIKKVVPLKSGNIRTVLDVGCGVASFGASLMDYNIITMSIAPRDSHEAQVQFALERGLPAMLGVLSINRLPFAARSFDMVHCSRCLVPWTDEGGLYLMEIDRVLRPGGYWVLSGPPIGWKTKWKNQGKDMAKEQVVLEEVAMKLCWKKIAEQDPIAVWRKPTNHVHCIKKSRTWKSSRFCGANDNADTGWYKRMEPCITRLPEVKDIKDTSGGALEKWPKRLNSLPPRYSSRKGKDNSVKTFSQDKQLWFRRISYYEKILRPLADGIYRNIMDMNAGLGGFAAALFKYPVWVMNVVPSDTHNTLGIIYERGLIGTYTNWCEAFSTYPRTYDLIHANRIFSIYIGKCDIFDILFEMQRILRPKGAVIIRDHVDIIVKVKSIIDKMGWNSEIRHSEGGPSNPEKILLVDNSER